MTVQYTQAEWFEKLKSFVPRQITQEEEGMLNAVFQAAALAFTQLGGIADNHVDDTFILKARDGTLDTHGGERSIFRINSYFRELDGPYAVRVQNVFSQADVLSIKQVVDKILLRGVSQIREDFDSSLFFNREEFFNRGAIVINPSIINTFTIVVDKQLHEPYSFMDREYFADREDFIGRAISSLEIFDLIKEVVDNSKALGTLYRIIERLE